MPELHDIVAAFDALAAAGKPCALATVVAVDGSAYRGPGARMLIAEDGRTWGGVSGGCLERDVADRARGVIAAGRPHLHRYDTSDEELIARGVTTGCGGTIDVLIEPVSATTPAVLPALAAVARERVAQRIATVIRATGAWGDLAGRSVPIGAMFQRPSERPTVSRVARDPFDQTDTRDEAERLASEAANSELSDDLLRCVHRAFADAPHPAHRVILYHRAATADVLLETLLPTPRLVLVGGGPDAVPVVAIAKTLGWHIAVVAARPALHLHARFADADERYVTGPDAPLDGVPIAAEDAVVVMTHNLARDAAVLAALPVRPKYLGLLGPRHRTDRATAALPPGHPGRAPHSPVGLDIGSDTPEEIALSIVAEVQATLRRADARPLSAKPIPVDRPCVT